MFETESYDQRQYRQIEKLVAKFEAGDASFFRLVNDIEALIMSLEKISDKDRNSLLGVWGILEEINAVAMDEGRSTLNSDEIADVKMVAAKIKALTKSFKEN